MQEMSFQHYLLGLFAVANNIAAIPLYINLIHGRTVKEQRKLCHIATLTAFLTMIITMLAGLAVLNFFQISVPAFRIAGGLLLLSTGFGMMNSVEKSIELTEQTFSKIISTAIIPIAIPITTGAGTMSTIILFSESAHNKPYLQFALLGAIIAMTILIYLSFWYAPKIVKYLGTTGLDVLTKIFGLITLALGIQFILTGISQAFPKIL
ncbi:MAG: MarC family protein [Bacteroidetes bacterium]|nr:MarC family protein [Bacteroidota bacterium]